MTNSKLNPLTVIPLPDLPRELSYKFAQSLIEDINIHDFTAKTNILEVDADYELTRTALKRLSNSHFGKKSPTMKIPKASRYINDPDIKEALRHLEKTVNFPDAKGGIRKKSVDSLLRKKWPFLTPDVQTQIFLRFFSSVLHSYSRKTRGMRLRMAYLENLVLSQYEMLETFREINILQKFIKEKYSARRSFMFYLKELKEREFQRVIELKGKQLWKSEFSLEPDSQFIKMMMELWFLKIKRSQAQDWFLLSAEQSAELRSHLIDLTRTNNLRWPINHKEESSDVKVGLKDEEILEVVM